MRANITDEVEGMGREESLFYRDQLRQANGAGIGDRFVQTLKEAIDPDITPTPLKLCCPHVCSKDAKIAEALNKCNGVPILVLSDDPNSLLGILTPFDLL
jgi:hypothetical protein